MKIFAPTLTLLLAIGVTAGAATADTLPAAEMAAAHYAAGRYAEAAQAYRTLAETEGVSAPLYYDLGAAQLAAGELGPAILSFSRGRWLAPNDAGIRAALQEAREKAGLPTEAPGLVGRVRDLASPDGWAVIAAAALFVAWAVTSLSLLSSESRMLVGWKRRMRHGIVATASVAALVAASACASLATERDQAVAVAPGVILRVAPFGAADRRGTLSLGEAVRTLERHGAFVRVRTADARTGWVPVHEIGAVVPG